MKTLPALVSTLVLGLASTASAALITSIDFNSPAYGTGALAGQNGWTVSGAGSQFQVGTSPGFNAGSQSFVYSGPTAATHRASFGFASTNSDTLFLRADVRFDGVYGTGRFFWIGLTSTAGTDNNSAGFLFREGQLQARATDSTSTTGTGPTYAAGTTYTVVLAVSKSTPGAANPYNTVRLFVNPDLSSGSSAPGTAQASVTSVAIGASSLSSLFLRSGSTVDNAALNDFFRIDNLALGTAWSDVTASAIPEPSSFAALAGLGMLGFAATRRRRAS